MTTAACPRCGTFAPLIPTEWRTLCGPCTLLGVHPIERSTTETLDLLGTTFKLFQETWQVGVALAVVFMVPKIAVSWAMEPPMWFSVGYSVLVGSFAEALYASYAAQWALGGVRDFKAAQARTSKRYFALVGVNALVNVAELVGMVLCCLPAVWVMSVSWSAVPLALFEAKGPIESIRESFRRTEGHRVRLLIASFVVFFVTGGPEMVFGFVKGVLRAQHVVLSPTVLSISRVVPELLLCVFNPFLEILQLTVWRATMPVAHAVAVAPAMATGPTQGAGPAAR